MEGSSAAPLTEAGSEVVEAVEAGGSNPLRRSWKGPILFHLLVDWSKILVAYGAQTTRLADAVDRVPVLAHLLVSGSGSMAGHASKSSRPKVLAVPLGSIGALIT